MKTLLSGLIFSVILITSCSKGSTSNTLGNIQADVDGEIVTSNGQGIIGGAYPGFHVTSSVFNISGINFPIINVPCPIHLTYYQIKNGDTTIYSSSKDTATLTLTYYNDTSKIMKGTFSGTVVDSLAVPITHNITNGQFNVKFVVVP
jgi:hypothetical protein